MRSTLLTMVATGIVALRSPAAARAQRRARLPLQRELPFRPLGPPISPVRSDRESAVVLALADLRFQDVPA